MVPYVWQLEAFRKQKAEGKTKKAVPASPILNKRNAAQTAAPSGEPVADDTSSVPSVLEAAPPLGTSAGRGPQDPTGPGIPANVQEPVPQAADHVQSVGFNGLDPENKVEQLSHRGQDSDGDGGGSADSTPPVLPVSRPPLMADSPPGSISKVTPHTTLDFIWSGRGVDCSMLCP